MKKLLVTLLCLGALVGLPGCGGCCKKSCDTYYEGENRRECHDEMQADGTMRRVCSDGEVITVYEGMEGKKGTQRTVRHKAKVLNPHVEGEPVVPCNPPVWAEVAEYEEVEPQKKSSRSRRSEPRRMQKEMMEEMDMQ